MKGVLMNNNPKDEHSPVKINRPDDTDENPVAGSSSASQQEQEVNHTLVMPSSQVKVLNQTGKNSRGGRKNLSARFSLEVFRKKNPNVSQKKEEVDEYFGRNLTRYTNIPIDNDPNLPDDSIPALSNRYEDLEIFNEGGQGIISAAKEKALGRIVALKTLKPKEDNPDSLAQDFITEAKVTAQLDHPSIIPIYAMGKNQDDQLQLAMKLVNGKTLREHLKNICLNYRLHGISAYDERASLLKRLEIYLHVCDALVYAHHRRIMHCDLKPENIMIGEYMEVYLMDWGLAKIIPDRKDDSEWVRPETIAGTPRYLSPEAVCGERIDERSDVFAMGLILQEIATLQYAVTGDDSSVIMHKIKDGQLDPPVHRYGCRIDRDLVAVIRKATAYRKENRYQSIRALAEDVRFYMQGNEVTANPDNPVMKMVRWMAHHRIVLLLIIFTAVALALGTATYSIYRNLKQTRLLGERSEMINHAYGKCFAAASLLDREILAQEKNLHLLAGLAARMLSSWTVHDDKIRFRIYDRNDRLPVPSDTVFSPWYKDKISFTEGVCRPVPGLESGETTLRVQQLSPLVYTMREIILESGTELSYLNTRNSNRYQAAVQNGQPVKSIYIGLKEGIQFGFPWRDIYQKGFDPRKRPWYLRGSNSDRPVWGKLYVGSDYHMGLCLPCSVRIQDEAGRFFGVAGMDLTFNKLADILHHTGNVGYFVLDSALIDSRGQIIVSSDKKKRQATYSQQDSEKNAEVSMAFFATPKIRRTILEQKFGFFSDFEPDRGEVLYLYAQMKTLNWIFVQKIDFEAYRTFFRRKQLMKKMTDAKNLNSPVPGKRKK